MTGTTEHAVSPSTIALGHGVFRARVPALWAAWGTGGSWSSSARPWAERAGQSGEAGSRATLGIIVGFAHVSAHHPGREVEVTSLGLSRAGFGVGCVIGPVRAARSRVGVHQSRRSGVPTPRRGVVGIPRRVWSKTGRICRCADNRARNRLSTLPGSQHDGPPQWRG